MVNRQVDGLLFFDFYKNIWYFIFIEFEFNVTSIKIF